MGLSKNNIILAAEQNVGRGTELDTIAATRLDLIVDEMIEDYLFEFFRTAADITLTAGSPTWTVPADYQKFEYMYLYRSDLNPTNPQTTPLPKMDYADFLKTVNPLQPGTPQYVALIRPYSDGSTPPNTTGYVWPVPTTTMTGKLSYFYHPSFSITGTAEYPFPDTLALVELLTNALLGMGYGKGIPGRIYNPRAMEEWVAKYRRNQADTGIYPMVAKLDGRVFQGRPGSWWTNRTWLGGS